jgi:hypothetical protein
VNRAEHATPPTVISHAHARDLAECWEDAARAHHPVTLLARTGEISHDAEGALAYDLNLLEMASASWGSPPSIPEKQLRVLLDYVRYHGPRPALENWRQLRDTDFLRSIRRMAAEVRMRGPLVYDPPDDRDGPRSAAAGQQHARR